VKSATAILFAMMALIVAPHAHACSCALNTPLEQLAISDVVVTASVVSVAQTDLGNGTVVSRALVAVESIWKGSETGSFVVETIASGSCEFTLQAGIKYLIYANRLSDDGLFSTHYCMRTQPAEYASTDFQDLGPPLGTSTASVPATWGFVKTRY
jgi:hypothetical protein